MREICGECKYHMQDDYHKNDWICTNHDSPYVLEYTAYDDWCDEWEQRGVD